MELLEASSGIVIGPGCSISTAILLDPGLSARPRWADRLHRDGFHGSQRGLLIEQLLDVGPSGALGLRNGAALLQGPGGVVQPAAQSLQVGVAGAPVGVGDEGEELGGAERPRGGALSRLCSDDFRVTRTSAVHLTGV